MLSMCFPNRFDSLEVQKVIFHFEILFTQFYFPFLRNRTKVSKFSHKRPDVFHHQLHKPANALLY